MLKFLKKYLNINKRGGHERSPLSIDEKKSGLRFILPCLFVLVLILAFPLGFSLIVSLFRYTFFEPVFDKFVFLDNYINIITSDPAFWNSLLITIKFMIFAVSLEFICGFFIALMLNRDIAFKEIFYIIMVIPMLMSPVAVALIWKMILHPQLGIANYYLEVIGGIPPVNWLGTSTNAFRSVIFVDIWQQISFMILILLSGLVSLPIDIFEAAEIDGASETQKIAYLTIPLMKPVIFAAVSLRIIFAFRTFGLVYVLTRGGPGTSTDFISYYIYRLVFMGLDLSNSSAASFILLIIVLVFIIVISRIMIRKN
jgi:multiple sugar transport system permease protein